MGRKTKTIYMSVRANSAEEKADPFLSSVASVRQMLDSTFNSSLQLKFCTTKTRRTIVSYIG